MSEPTLNERVTALLSNVLIIVRQASFNIQGEQIEVVNGELKNFEGLVEKLGANELIVSEVEQDETDANIVND